jgi:hypothetical protein
MANPTEQTSADHGDVGFDHTLTMAAAARPLKRRERRRRPGPAGNLKPAKDKSTERIDGIVATIMAIGRALVAQEEPQPEYSLHFM